MRRRGRSVVVSRPPGSVARTASADSTVRTATAQNAARQLACCASSVPAGTPRIIDRLSPDTTTDIALPRRSAGTTETAATEASVQNPAYAIPVTTRIASRNPKSGTSAAATCPATNTVWKPTRADRRGSRSVASVSSGAPTIMPAANAETSSPASGRDTPRSSASGGSSPESMNSEVPCAKVPRPRRYTRTGMALRGTWPGGRRPGSPGPAARPAPYMAQPSRGPGGPPSARCRCGPGRILGGWSRTPNSETSSAADEPV